jgi:predicted hydrocarbon binding protein
MSSTKYATTNKKNKKNLNKNIDVDDCVMTAVVKKSPLCLFVEGEIQSVLQTATGTQILGKLPILLRRKLYTLV